ncbi:transglycosylase SLT domain-containing protein [Ancylobacter dichloromethanicus]|uniref:Lytic transglycosylase n=1 Tax=Ancylobacter dichloromethanicus TaxID=518825 RepID=A0A9W6J3B8_9HYPH|nr:transglycosylase SLT domain-containing protein [Ancylobacter dichloromethanicus]MBS7556289.1 transglycosylase SLT domain-containing protein [Ancylobacter dichloromethanicus]GLK70051.1 lytic transglycosylase [Ancylobacter dichloromethanicus]
MSIRRISLLTATLLSSTVAAIAPAQTGQLGACEAAMERAAARHDVPLAILYAVGLTETGGNGTLQPLAMNGGGESYVANSLADGERKLADFVRRGIKLVDLGCMQINYRWHGDQFDSVAQMFEPERNVDYAARFLATLKRQHGNWTMAAARYNAGPNNDPAQKKYVCAVIRNLVRSGFGSWTDQSRAFCG